MYIYNIYIYLIFAICCSYFFLLNIFCVCVLFFKNFRLVGDVFHTFYASWHRVFPTHIYFIENLGANWRRLLQSEAYRFIFYPLSINQRDASKRFISISLELYKVVGLTNSTIRKIVIEQILIFHIYCFFYCMSPVLSMNESAPK